MQKTATPIHLSFRLLTRVGRRMHKFNRIRQVAPMCPCGRTRCRHMSNNIEPFVYGGDAPYGKLIWPCTCYLWPLPLIQSHRQPNASSRVLYCGHSTQYGHLVCLKSAVKSQPTNHCNQRLIVCRYTSRYSELDCISGIRYATRKPSLEVASTGSTQLFAEACRLTL